MTMYLPNPDLQPTGSEMTEFLDIPPMVDVPDQADVALEDETEPPCD